jgi:predicted methyltransferase
MKTRLLLTAAAALALTAASAGAAPSHIEAAVANAVRPEAEMARDEARKPAEMLTFAGVEPGWKVAELLPGQGYFTRILAKAVGPEGKVYAAVPPPQFEQARGAGNVVPIAFAGPGFTTPEPVDLIFTAQNYHDLHLSRLNLDVAAVNKALFEALKPGGVLLVIDHVAADGAPLETADTLHRIDPAKARAELEAAGFVFEGESDAIRNPADDHTKGVFDASIRGQTDQFVYKFRKPA